MDKMGTLRRTHYNIQSLEAKPGEEIVVAGFVARLRDMGGLIFCDLRDCTGILQLAFDDTSDRAVFEKAKSLSGESVVMAKGTVRERSGKNSELPTGGIEVFVSQLLILSRGATPPFEIRDEAQVREELALKYRYLDLRRPSLNSSMMVRHKIVKSTRDYFDENGFVEIETPMLIRSTPEGARDYIVPSRVHAGKFYALPQSPQLYKQLLMVGGIDRYIQIARCFRDEDLRADRQPEFTQIDLEMAFSDIDDIIAMNEGFLKRIVREFLGHDIALPLRRIPCAEAMRRFGSDKPDTRFGMELVDLTDILKDCDFSVFSAAASSGGSVRAINAKGLVGYLTRKEIDRLTEFVKTYRAKGLAYTRFLEDGATSSYEKFLSEKHVAEVREACGAECGDVIFIVAADDATVFASLGALRLEIARKFDLIDETCLDLLWITEFPLFEYSEEDDRYYAVHHPFTAPMDEDMEMIESAPTACRAKAYDIIFNGVEIGGGSIRISDPALQRRMFTALGFSDDEAEEQFGFLTDAYTFGAPPHGGIAYGLDRLVMLMLGKKSIRDVIAFPKVQSAAELMTLAPSAVTDRQLEELHISHKLADGE